MLDAETARVILPLGEHAAGQIGSRLVETVAVAQSGRIQHTAVTLVLGQLIHHVAIGDDDQVERALATVLKGYAVVRIVLAAVVAHELLHHHALALVAGKHACGEAVFLVENLVQAHTVGVLGRVDEVADQHAHVAGTLSFQDLVENQLEVGIAGITNACRALVDVAVLEELVYRVLVGVDAVINDVDIDLAAGGEMVDQVVHGLFQLTASPALVIGDHRAAALKIHRQRQVVHTAIGARVPMHRGTQL